ncbi:MAG: hypothetical protein R2697_02155 [Ilumatobacteraceae bacterium]
MIQLRSATTDPHADRRRCSTSSVQVAVLDEPNTTSTTSNNPVFAWG